MASDKITPEQTAAVEIGTALFAYVPDSENLQRTKLHHLMVDAERVEIELIYLRACTVVFATDVALDRASLRDAVLSVYNCHLEEMDKESLGGAAAYGGVVSRSSVYAKAIQNSLNQDDFVRIGHAFARLCNCEGDAAVAELGASEFTRTFRAVVEYLQNQPSLQPPPPPPQPPRPDEPSVRSDPERPKDSPIRRKPPILPLTPRGFRLLGLIVFIVLLALFLGLKHYGSWLSSFLRPQQGPTIARPERERPAPPPSPPSEKPTESPAGSTPLPAPPAPLQSATENGRKYILDMIVAAMVEGGIEHEEDILEAKRRVEELSVRNQLPRGDRKKAGGHIERGLTYLKDGQFADAVHAFEEAYQAAGTDVEILNNLGYARLRNGELEAARQTLFHALVLVPGSSNAWAVLGQTYAKQGGPVAAVACFANAYRFSRNQDATRRVSSTINRRQGR